MEYLFTFHTNFDANLLIKKLKPFGSVTQKPVPRKLSSSCGTAVVFSPSDSGFQTNDLKSLTFEKLYSVAGQNYTLLVEKE